MINSKVLLGIAFVASTLLAGCSKDNSEQATAAAAIQLSSLKADVDYAKAEANRANERLDNLTVGYKK